MQQQQVATATFDDGDWRRRRTAVIAVVVPAVSDATLRSGACWTMAASMGCTIIVRLLLPGFTSLLVACFLSHGARII